MSDYATPGYNYTSQTNALNRQKGLQDATRNYSQFISQERFRRGREDNQLGFQRNFPRVGAGFNRRGMWNSGLRKQGQQMAAGDFSRAQGRVNWDNAANDQGFAIDKAQSDAAYQSALQAAYDQFKKAQATQAAYNQAKVY